MIDTETRKTFIELCISGKASPDDIYQFIREWHESDSTEPLEKYLGMSFEDYALWVKDPKLLKYIVIAHKKNVPLSMVMPKTKPARPCKQEYSQKPEAKDRI
ncbi:MAG: hypothetical protein ACYC9O_08355 [Candidatus Latescibacterota bacterium]